jgi:D-3-phosphoglycerate dehydrogenase
LLNWTIIITEPINVAGVALLKDVGVNVIHLPPGSNETDLAKIINEADGLITRGTIKITRELMSSSKRLKVVGVHGIGCDHIDLQAAKELGKIVCNTPDALTVTVAEMAVALILATTRRIVSADRAVRLGEWNRKYSDLIGTELSGKTIGLIGLGRIGESTAKRLVPFDVKLIYWSRTRKQDIEKSLGIEYVDLESLLKTSDIISLHIPGNDETHHFVDEKKISKMKNGAMIINTARGRVIDENSLVEAINNGKISYVALDVFEKEPIQAENPLIKMDAAILTPHIAASSREAMIRMAIQVAEEVLLAIKGEEPPNRVV